MVGASKPYRLKGEDLLLEVGSSPEADGQIDLPEGVHSLAEGDAMKRRGPSLDLGLAYQHEVQGVIIDDDDVASIHEYLGETGVADDGVYDERVILGVWDVVQVVIPVEGDGTAASTKKISWCSCFRCLEERFTEGPPNIM
jgi:hypothetical protein